MPQTRAEFKSLIDETIKRLIKSKPTREQFESDMFSIINVDEYNNLPEIDRRVLHFYLVNQYIKTIEEYTVIIATKKDGTKVLWNTDLKDEIVSVSSVWYDVITSTNKEGFVTIVKIPSDKQFWSIKA